MGFPKKFKLNYISSKYICGIRLVEKKGVTEAASCDSFVWFDEVRGGVAFND